MIGFLGFLPLLIIFPSAYSHLNNLMLLYLSGQKEQGLVNCTYLSEHYICSLPIPGRFEFYNMTVGGRCRETEKSTTVTLLLLLKVFNN